MEAGTVVQPTTVPIQQCLLLRSSSLLLCCACYVLLCCECPNS
jgi:hypothetical protein